MLYSVYATHKGQEKEASQVATKTSDLRLVEIGSGLGFQVSSITSSSKHHCQHSKPGYGHPIIFSKIPIWGSDKDSFSTIQAPSSGLVATNLLACWQQVESMVESLDISFIGALSDTFKFTNSYI